MFCLTFGIQFIYYDATLGICVHVCRLIGLRTIEQVLEQIQHQRNSSIILQVKHGRFESVLLPYVDLRT